MMRSNPDTRSHESQILRHSGDNFFQDTTVVGGWELFWGKASGPVPTSSPGFGKNTFAGLFYEAGKKSGLFK